MRSVVVVSMGLFMCLSSPAWAEDKPVETTTDLARNLHGEGNEVLKKRGCEKAILFLRAAYATEPLHQIAGSLGQCEMELGHYVEAATHLEQFVREYDPQKDPQKHALAKAMLVEAKKHVATLSLKQISAGAEVFVDGKSMGISPIDVEVFVEPGPHTVRAVLGSMVGETEVMGKEGVRMEVRVELRAPVITRQAPVGMSPRKVTGVALVATGLSMAIGGGVLGVWSRMYESRVQTSLDGSSLNRAGSTPQESTGAVIESPCEPGTDKTNECVVRKGLQGQLDILSRLDTLPFVIGGIGAAAAVAGGVMIVVPEAKPMNVGFSATPLGCSIHVGANF